MNRYLWLVVCFIAVVLLVAWGASRTVHPGSTAYESVSASTFVATTSAYVVDAQYPVFGIASIDGYLKQYVQGAIVVFEQLPQNPHGSATPQNTFTGIFQDPYSGPDYVSVKLILMQYTGGAHPMTAVDGMTFDKASGKRLVLADVLPLIGKDITQLSTDATAKLKTKLADGFLFPEGANTNPENFKSFVVGSSTVTFIFQQYQVAPYVYGAPEVSFERVK